MVFALSGSIGARFTRGLVKKGCCHLCKMTEHPLTTRSLELRSMSIPSLSLSCCRLAIIAKVCLDQAKVFLQDHRSVRTQLRIIKELKCLDSARETILQGPCRISNSINVSTKALNNIELCDRRADSFDKKEEQSRQSISQPCRCRTP